MYVVIQHKIDDPARFWEIAKAATQNLPEGMKLFSIWPNADGSKASCLWESPSVEALKDFVEPHVKDISTNDYFEVAAHMAVGLPG